MTEKEFGLFALALKTYYPKEGLLPNNQAMELWYRQVADIPYNIAEAALNKWVATNKWSPTIADIREMSISVSHGDIPTWGDAWEEVCRAIRKFGSYRAGEAIETLSPLAKKATQRIGFTNLCMSENVAADRANFRMIYETLAERQKKEAQLPLPLKQLIAELQNDTKLIEKPEKNY